MIKAGSEANARHWSQTLLAGAQALAEHELSRLSARVATQRHPWRQATQLWPHLFED